MSADPFLDLFPLLIVALGLGLLVLAILRDHEHLALIGAALVLANANWPSVSSVTREVGIGAGVLLISNVFVLLVLAFRLNPLKLPRSLVRGPGVLILASIYYIAVVSPLVSINPIASVRTSLSFTLVCLVGWYVFGKIFSLSPGLARMRVHTLIYVTAVNSLLIIVMLAIVMGPSARRLAIGGIESRISLGPVATSRLQAEGFNATGLAMLAAGVLFVILHWYQNSINQPFKKTVLMLLGGLTVLLLLWTGGRSAIIAFGVTTVCLGAMTSVRNIRRALCNIVLLSIASMAIYLFKDHLTGIFWRGDVKAELSKSLVDLFLQSRIEGAISALEYYRENIVLGNGIGVLSRSVFNVEAFFIRILIELGFVGGSIYVLTFLWLTYYVIKVDMHYLRQGEPGAWLPSSVFLFMWIISPASYGFSLFTGVLALQVAIAAGAVIEWDQITQNKLC